MRKPPRWHPLVGELVSHARKSSNGALLFSHSAVSAVSASGQQIAKGIELFQLVGDLLKLSALMSEDGNAEASAALGDAAASLAPRLGELAKAGSVSEQRAFDDMRRAAEGARRATGHNPAAGLAPKGAAGVGIRSKSPSTKR